jgi:hypothetical protein
MTATGRDGVWIRDALGRKFYDLGRRVPPRDKHAILADGSPIDALGVQGLRSDHGATPIAAVVKRICAVIDRIAEGIDVASVCQGGGEA